MCDTFVALGSATADGSVILGKNSDREPNEAHEVGIVPAADHAPGSTVRCTYIEIPQAAHTHAVLLCKPFWIWGAEMGLNEHGVAIGNEAIFTKVPYGKDAGLIGMDFLRLGLERAASADEALQVITGLLEQYGQSGSCGFTHPFYYHNSFLIADRQAAWVLETAGRHWVAERVRGVRSISNRATIGANFDAASPDVVRYAIERGWCKSQADFDFARCYSDFLYTTLSDARSRQVCTTELLLRQQGKVTPGTAMRILRSHGMDGQAARIDQSLTGASVCMHVGAGPVRNSQSTGSLVAQITSEGQAAWVTATSAPCTGIFKPVWLEGGMPFEEPTPTGTFDPACLWWRHERLHRAVLEDFPARLEPFAADRDALEARFLAMAAGAAGIEDRRACSSECFALAEQQETAWLKCVLAQPAARANRFYYQRAWRNFNRHAGMESATVRK